MMSTPKYFCCSLLAALVLASCGKKDNYDITGDPEIKFFTNEVNAGNAPPNSISFSVVNIPDVNGPGWANLSSTVPDAIKFPVRASREVTAEVTVSAELDNSLIDAYNAAHNTDYKPFPAGILNTQSLAARIPAGASRSADSITITAETASLHLLTEKAYMAPIRLTSVSNPAAGAISSNTAIQVTYIVVHVQLRRIAYNRPAAQATGSLIADRSSWTALLSPNPTQVSGGGSILDGSTTSYSRWGASPGQADVNMQEVKQVTGIRVYTSTSSTMTPTQIEVYLSEDGVNYDAIGAPLRADLAYASGYTYILFYKAIPAKFIRLVLHYSTSTNTQNLRLAELQVYAE